MIDPRRACALGLAMLACALPGSVHAAPENQIAISYVVEVGSMSAMRISYNAKLSEKAYQSTASIKTKGLASVFSDYQMDMASSGVFDGDGIKPQRYRSKAEKKSEENILEVRWRDDDMPGINSIPKDKEDEALIASGLTSGLVDPLSMLMRMTALQAGKPCRSVERVVDGKDVYDLHFALAGEVTLGSNNPGPYRGKAFKCSMIYTPVAGRAARKYKRKGGAPSKFDVWFAPVLSGSSENAYFVPILATGKLQGLRFIAYARKASIDGRPIGATQD